MGVLVAWVGSRPQIHQRILVLEFQVWDFQISDKYEPRKTKDVKHYTLSKITTLLLLFKYFDYNDCVR